MFTMTLDMIANCPFRYDYEICGDSMTAAVWCGVHMLYYVEVK